MSAATNGSAILRASGTTVWVLDQDEALDFYTATLGFEVADDLDLGFARWLTVRPRGQADTRIVLADPRTTMRPDDAALVATLLGRRLGSGPLLRTDDARTAYERLTGRGAEVSQPLAASAYGVDFEVLDPSGNRIRVVEDPRPQVADL